MIETPINYTAKPFEGIIVTDTRTKVAEHATERIGGYYKIKASPPAPNVPLGPPNREWWRKGRPR